MYDLSKVSVVLPSLDPDEKLNIVIAGLLEYGFSHIILVNDGSKPENLHYFTQAEAANPGIITLLHHPVNRGKGAALKTAFNWFLENRPEGLGVVTVDGDNQHHPADTRRVAMDMLEKNHLVLGCRDFDLPQVPARSRKGNKITCTVFKLFVGMTISDTQTGLRAIPRKDLPLMASIAGDRFEYETNMLLALKENHIPWGEVEIRTVYIEENKSSHFRAFQDSWRIYKLILAHFFRYSVSSAVSAVVDEGLFQLLYFLVSCSPYAIAVSTLVARAFSSALNFYMNRRLVFKDKGDIGPELAKYYALAIPVAIAQVVLTMGAVELLKWLKAPVLLQNLSHLIVMVLLYFVSFTVQQRWVFTGKKTK